MKQKAWSLSFVFVFLEGAGLRRSTVEGGGGGGGAQSDNALKTVNGSKHTRDKKRLSFCSL